MFGKVFGGPIVQLVEYHDGQLLYRAKREPKTGPSQPIRVAGQLGKPAKIKISVQSTRPLDTGGFACTGSVTDAGHQRELSRLRSYTLTPEPGMRRHPRSARRVDIDCTDLRATSIDISTGGMQVETQMTLTPGATLKLQLMPGLGCQARVAWVQGQRAGLEFWETDDATKLLLSRFASGRMIPTASKPTKRNKTVAPPDYESLS
jgi:PilZ domain